MLKEDQLLTSILSTTHAERALVVDYLKLQAHGTKSPEIAGNIFNALIQQEYVNWEDDAELAHIENIAQTLVDKNDDQALWKELFERIEKL
jgi:hypothetical protein